MSTQFTVTIKKPEDGLVAPGTGVLTTPVEINQAPNANASSSGAAFISGVIILSFLAVVAVLFVLNRKKTKKMQISKFKTTLGFTALILAVTGALALSLKHNYQETKPALAAGDENTLSIITSDVNLVAEVGDVPVYTMAKDTVTVNSATKAGYILSAYVDKTDVVLPDTEHKVAGLTNGKPSSLQDNTWGISLTEPTSAEDEVFIGLPADPNDAFIIKNTTGATEANDQTTLYYSAYVTPDLPYGTYTGVTVTYLATVHPSALYMQDVSEWGGTLSMGDEVDAIDKRDNKTYKVARLADDNLWMTQNLDLDLDEEVTYTNEDTDIGWNIATNSYDEETWVPAESTAIGRPIWSPNAQDPIIRSLDPGDIYWNGNTEGSSAAWNTYRSSCSYSPPYACDESLNPLPTYTNSTSDPHFHIGNYYNWNAAVATNDSSIYVDEYTNIERSICPSGWTLPRGGYGEDTFYALVSAYDTFVLSNSYAGTLVNSTKLWEEPLYFILSGERAFNNFYYIGNIGGFWASTFAIYGRSYYMYHGANGAITFFHENINNGISVRCIARPVSNEFIFSAP